MSDLKLFRISDGVANELIGGSVELERSLQRVIERNMEVVLGVRFLASEHSTGARHGGRIDTLGLDENGSPVIVEYKRSINENVINQGLFYLDWLVDHKAEFRWLVMERLGAEMAGAIDWRSPRLICIARGFTKYDEHAVQQMGRNIELIRYSDYGGEILALELQAGALQESNTDIGAPDPAGGQKSPSYSTVTDLLRKSPQELRDLLSGLEAAIEALGDDISKKTLKFYFAYRRLKNFACIEVHPQTHTLLVYVKVDPDAVELVPGFSRDVRQIGHFGTGDLELRIKSAADLHRAVPLLQRSYDAS